ncbi:head-tail connector protein [Pseudoalteromonas peptidolytica]|nr:head-tail connector protein [Pseudoalteromonas peptidolytica]NLR16566.1 phage gp6-like head-tail connector protein [Pseudoalteromonas peptidolytica]GEK08936.1 hypothetical protein PPE03_11850 [Pseudoalteromonas peptidolytica]
MIITLVRAKQQLNVEDDFDNPKIEALIPQAIGLVVADIGRDIYQTGAEVPENAECPIILDEISPFKRANLETATLLQLGSLWSTAEAETSRPMTETKAYQSAIKPFVRVLVG